MKLDFHNPLYLVWDGCRTGQESFLSTLIYFPFFFWYSGNCECHNLPDLPFICVPAPVPTLITSHTSYGCWLLLWSPHLWRKLPVKPWALKECVQRNIESPGNWRLLFVYNTYSYLECTKNTEDMFFFFSSLRIYNLIKQLKHEEMNWLKNILAIRIR